MKAWSEKFFLSLFGFIFMFLVFHETKIQKQKNFHPTPNGN